MSAPSSQAMAAVFAALSNPHRTAIMRHLVKGETTPNALSRQIGLSQSATSQHLARLRAAGLVMTRRDSVTIHYSCVVAYQMEYLLKVTQSYADTLSSGAVSDAQPAKAEYP